VIWGPKLGQVTQLSPLSGDLDGAATAINDKGEVVGISGICDQAVGRFTAKHAVLWQNGTPTDLGNFDGGMAWNTPTAINNFGQVVGFANQAGTTGGAFNSVGFIWTKDKLIQEVPPVGTDGINLAWGVGEQGQVVGQSCIDNSFSGCRAFLWRNGVTTDLNSLIQPGSSLYLLLANDMNESGEIVGFALDNNTGDVVAFLAVPSNGGNDSKVNATPRISQTVIVPDNVRQMLRQRAMGRVSR
jgi:probable HAF family extracellular repeat protein